MRITNAMITDSMLESLRGNQERVEKLHRQLTTGKKLTRPSDDPASVGRALAYRAGIAQGDQYIRTMDASLTWLNATDSTLDSAIKGLQRGRELAVQGANDTLGTQQQQAIAAEVDQILNQMIQLGNSSLRGQRLFAGLKTDTNPFTAVGTPATSVTYTGDTSQMLREIDVGSTIAINVPGSAVFPSTFSALIKLRNDLNAGNTSAVKTDISGLDTAFDDILGVRADVGARINRIEAARERQEDLQVRMKDLSSKTEDVDLEEAISQFAVEQTAYQSALAAGAKAVQPSLLDYLR